MFNIKRYVAKCLARNDKGIMQLVMLAVALLIVFVIWQILPLVNANIATSITLPGTGAGSEWNSSVNPQLVNASSMFQSVGGIYKVTLIVAIVAVLLAYLFTIVPKQGGGTGGI